VIHSVSSDSTFSFFLQLSTWYQRIGPLCPWLNVRLICGHSFGRQLVEEAAQLCSAKVRRTDTPTASGGSAGAAAGGGGAGGSAASSATEDASATSGSGPGRVCSFGDHVWVSNAVLWQRCWSLSSAFTDNLSAAGDRILDCFMRG
jgi:hypothetical protein